MAFDASTVLLVRDAPGLQVFMVERHIESDFVGGAYVFPGGKVDELDRQTEAWAGIDPAAEARRMGVGPDEALALYVAAARETFEEAGVLLATRNGQSVGSDFLEDPANAEFRRRMANRHEEVDWREWLDRHDLVLDLGALHWWSWWVTPEGLPKRFDTRFFLARTPPDQVAEHDAVEATNSSWLSPRDALESHARREVEIILPTRRNLVDLGQFPTVDAALVDARGRNPRAIVPRIVTFEGGLAVDHDSFEGPEQV